MPQSKEHAEVLGWAQANKDWLEKAKAYSIIDGDINLNSDLMPDTRVAGHALRDTRKLPQPTPAQKKPAAKTYGTPDYSQFTNDPDFSQKDLAQLQAHMSRNGNDPKKALELLYDTVHGPDWEGILENERRKDRKVAAWLQSLIKDGGAGKPDKAAAPPAPDKAPHIPYAKDINGDFRPYAGPSEKERKALDAAAASMPRRRWGRPGYNGPSATEKAALLEAAGRPYTADKFTKLPGYSDKEQGQNEKKE